MKLKPTVHVIPTIVYVMPNFLYWLDDVYAESHPNELLPQRVVMPKVILTSCYLNVWYGQLCCHELLMCHGLTLSFRS